ncbi:MAG: glutamate-cysteine ligase family protein [Aerococcus sp.]|nr:glutamate-cysteine ligase family protein [Aerococcus sp.]
MSHEAHVARIVDYMRAGEKSKSDYRIGLECEHFTVYKDSLETVPFEGADGIESSLIELSHKGYRPVTEKGHTVGLEGDGISFSTEPASQFEISVDASLSIEKLEQAYQGAIRDVLDVFEAKNQYVVAIGAQPKSQLKDISLIPKARYRLMERYFDQGAYGVMKSSASVQALFDYSDEEDFRKKYQVATVLAPLLHSAYDTAYIFDGKPYDKYSLRQDLWLACDPDRCGVIPTTFDDDFGYEKYAEKILSMPSIFYETADDTIYTGKRTFDEILGKDDSEDMVEFALSMCFFDIRAKQCLEVRSPDAVPYPLNFSVPALTKGIFYNEPLLDRLYQEIAGISVQDIDALKEDCRTNGWRATFRGQTVPEIVGQLAHAAQDFLPEGEKHYLEPLIALVESGEMLHTSFGKTYEVNAQDAVASYALKPQWLVETAD